MLNLRAYSAHEALVRPAREKAQVWRLAIGVILIAGVFLLGNQLVHQMAFTLFGPAGYAGLTGMDGTASQWSVVFLLMTFGLMTVGVLVALRVAHTRDFAPLLGERSAFAAQFWSVLTVLAVLNIALLILPPWDIGGPLVANVSPLRWFLMLPVALLAVLVQVSAEEILFRGYLQQQLAGRFKTPLIWIGVPAILFGLGHYMPLEAGENANFIMAWAVIFGVLMADLTARAGTLGPAIAVHLVNNVIAIIFISMPDSLSGLSLYLSPFSLNDTEVVRAWLPVEFGVMIVSWLAARLAIRR